MEEEADLHLWASTSEDGDGEERQGGGGQRVGKNGHGAGGAKGATVAGQTQV
jgi:hypothetical protein